MPVKKSEANDHQRLQPKSDTDNPQVITQANWQSCTFNMLQAQTGLT